MTEGMKTLRGEGGAMQQKRLDNSPIAYFVSRTGHAPWVLLIHAAFVHHGMFREQFAYFEGRYNLLAVDIIGHGQSTDTRRGDTVERMSEWIAGILAAEGIGRAHIAGVSLGAVLAQDFANRYPQAVRSLACFGGYDVNHFDGSMRKENSAAQMRMMLKALVSVKWFAEANKKISACTPQAQDAFFEMNLRFPKKSFRFLAGLRRMVNRYETGRRGYPLLIGCGELDLPMAQEAVREWKSREPGCTAVFLEHAGHCANMDAPEAFNRILEAFWKGAEG